MAVRVRGHGVVEDRPVVVRGVEEDVGVEHDVGGRAVGDHGDPQGRRVEGPVPGHEEHVVVVLGRMLAVVARLGLAPARGHGGGHADVGAGDVVPVGDRPGLGVEKGLTVAGHRLRGQVEDQVHRGRVRPLHLVAVGGGAQDIGVGGRRRGEDGGEDQDESGGSGAHGRGVLSNPRTDLGDAAHPIVNPWRSRRFGVCCAAPSTVPPPGRRGGPGVPGPGSRGPP